MKKLEYVIAYLKNDNKTLDKLFLKESTKRRASIFEACSFIEDCMKRLVDCYSDNEIKFKKYSYEFKKYILVAQKEQLEISMYEKIGNDYKLILRNNVIVGENPGDKYTEGDKRTPEGAYELVEKKVGLDSFYGPFALVTSYPNVFEQSLDKKGSGIWIHGMPYYTDREKFTKGCVALDNTELENLEKKLDLNKTILLISENTFKKATKEEMALIFTSIYKWKDAWKYSNIEEYHQMYEKRYLHPPRMNLRHFYMMKHSSKNLSTSDYPQ